MLKQRLRQVSESQEETRRLLMLSKVLVVCKLLLGRAMVRRTVRQTAATGCSVSARIVAGKSRARSKALAGARTAML